MKEYWESIKENKDWTRCTNRRCCMMDDLTRDDITMTIKRVMSVKILKFDGWGGKSD